MQFGDFAREAGGPVAKDFAYFCDGFFDAVRRFVEDNGAIFNAQTFDGTLSFTAARGQKTDKKKFFIRQTRSGKRGQQRAGPRNGHYGNFVTEAKGDESMAGIGNQRHAGVADQGNFGALFHGKNKFGGAGDFIVLVIAHQRLMDIVVIQKF